MFRRKTQSTLPVQSTQLQRAPLSLPQLQAKIKEDVLGELQANKEVELQTNAIFQAIKRKLEIYINLLSESAHYNLLRLIEQITHLTTSLAAQKQSWVIGKLSRPLEKMLHTHHPYYDNTQLNITTYIPLDKTVIVEPPYRRCTEFFKLAFTDDLEELKWQLPTEAGRQRVIGAEGIIKTITDDINNTLLNINLLQSDYISINKVTKDLLLKHNTLLMSYGELQNFINDVFLTPLNTILEKFKEIAKELGSVDVSPLLSAKIHEWVQEYTPDDKPDEVVFLREMKGLPIRALPNPPTLSCEFNGNKLSSGILIDIHNDAKHSTPSDHKPFIKRIKDNLTHCGINERFHNHLCTRLHQGAMLKLSLKLIHAYFASPTYDTRLNLEEKYKHITINSVENFLSVTIYCYLFFIPTQVLRAYPEITECTKMKVMYELFENNQKISYSNPRVEFSGPNKENIHSLFNRAMFPVSSAPASPSPQKRSSPPPSPPQGPPGSAPMSPVAASSPLGSAISPRPRPNPGAHVAAAGAIHRKPPPKKILLEPGSTATSTLASALPSPFPSPAKSSQPLVSAGPWLFVDGRKGQSPSWREIEAKSKPSGQ